MIRTVHRFGKNGLDLTRSASYTSISSISSSRNFIRYVSVTEAKVGVSLFAFTSALILSSYPGTCHSAKSPASEDFDHNFDATTVFETAKAAVRAFRLVLCVSQMLLDYKLNDLRQELGFLSSTADQIDLDRKLVLLQEAQCKQAEVADRELLAKTTSDKESLRKEALRCRDTVILAARTITETELLGVKSTKSVVHERAAMRLLELCRKNGGIYVKLGQHIAQLDYVVPPEYVAILKCMLDDAPTSSIQDVRQVIWEELGRYPEELWKNFNPVPIASASLAQVHEAFDSNGRKLAIKVQHRGLREASQGDIETVKFVVNLLEFFFPQFSYSWLADEVSENLPQELDFMMEGRNAEKCGNNFVGRDDIVVPSICWPETTNRVLTMSFEDGVRAIDTDKIKALGLKLPAVAQLLSEAFYEQAFRFGFVHCDPHGANVLVREHPSKPGRPQLVLLDHGLYRSLDRDFRLEYCRLWRNLVLGDVKGIRRGCEAMNAGDMYPLMAAMITSRPWDDVVDIGLGSVRMDEIDVQKRMVQGYVQQYFSQIQHLLGKVPRPLLLLLKTNDCLRHIDRSLGASVNTFLVASQIAISVLDEEEQKCNYKSRSLKSFFMNSAQYMHLRLLLWGGKWIAWRSQKDIGV